MTNLLDQILDRVDRLDAQPKEELIDAASAGTRRFAWVPNPGQQSDAYFCQADELFYGAKPAAGRSIWGSGWRSSHIGAALCFGASTRMR
jgi:hypothetical protein